SCAGRRHADLDRAAATATADGDDESLIPLIEVRGVGHNYLKREGARACRLAREPTCGWGQSDPRGQSAGFHREMVGEFSTANCQHSIVRLTDGAGGKSSVEKQVVRGRVILRASGLRQRTARGGRQRDCQQEDYKTHALCERRGKFG